MRCFDLYDGFDKREKNTHELTSATSPFTHRRGHAHFLAYSYLDMAFIPAILATGFKMHPLFAVTYPALQAFCNHLPYGLLFAAILLYYTLPQTILFWTEPDMEQEAD